MKARRIVQASSSSVYGHTDGRPSTEASPTQPASPYGVSKLAAEQLCLAYVAQPGCVTSALALRYFTLYGPRQRRDMFIHRVLNAATGGPKVPIYGNTNVRRDFTYIADAVAATIAAASPDLESGVINVGAGSNHSLADVLRIVRLLTGRPVPVLWSQAPGGDVPETLADPRRARQLLGWQANTALPLGLADQLHLMTVDPATRDPASTTRSPLATEQHPRNAGHAQDPQRYAAGP